MNKTPKVSIIIPFYNVEKYIDECIKSVVNQTLKDIEIIFVNDGSEDGSLKIVNKYAQKDSRIKVLSLDERHGQGFARNRAIDVATGEYIGFVDSDDYVRNDMFEKLYVSAVQSDTDITMCLAKEYDDTTGNFIESDYYSLKLFEQYKEDVFSSEDTVSKVLDMNVALWNKLYKRSYLTKINEKFPEGYIFEDLPFFFGTYLPAKKIKILWESLYVYRINRKTSTMNQFGNKMLDRVPMVALTYEKLKKYSLFEKIEKDVQAWIINDIFHRYTLLSVGYQKEYFFSMKKLFTSMNIQNPDEEYWQRVFHFRGYLLVMNNSFEEFNQKIFYKYIDLNEIEDRFNSKILNIRTAIATHGANIISADKRIAKLYDDLQVGYKYSEEIVGKLDNKLQKCVDDIYKAFATIYDYDIPKVYEYVESAKNVISEIQNDKINNVYEELTKNYKYTEKIVSDAENRVSVELSDRVSKIYEEIPKIYDYTNSAKDEVFEKSADRINLIYQDIEKNYKYTEKIVADSESKTGAEFDVKLSKVYEEITKVYDYVNQYKNYVSENSETSPEQIKVSISGSIADYFAEKHIDEILKNINDELENTKKYLIDYAENCKKASIDEAGIKLNSLYEDIDKNYKYTDELVSNSEIKCATGIDEKISKIYEDFNKVYEYINSCKEDNSFLTKECTDKIYEELGNLKENIEKNILESVREAKIEAFDNCEKIRNEISEIQAKNIEASKLEFNNIFETIAKNNSELLKRVDNVEKNTSEKQIQNENALSAVKSVMEKKYGEVVITETELKKRVNDTELQIKKSFEESASIRLDVEEKINETNHLIANVKDNFEQNIKETNQSLENVKDIFEQNIKDVTSSLTAGFNNVNKRFEETENSIVAAEKSISALNNEIKNNTKTFINLYEEIKNIQDENKIKADEKINSLEENLLSKIKNLETKSRELNEKTDNTDTKINQIHVKMENKITDVELALENKINFSDKHTSEKIKDLYSYTNNELSNVYKSFNETNSEIIKDIRSKTEHEEKRFYQSSYMISEINKTVEKKADIEEFEKFRGNISSDIGSVKSDFENKLSIIKAEYEAKLEEQKITYENRLSDFENKLNLLEEERKERQKSLFQKLFAGKRNK